MISPSIYPPMFRPCLDGARPYPITRSLAPVVAKYLYACRLLPKIASSASGRVKHRAAAHADAADYPVADRFFGLSFVPRSHGSRADGKVCMSEIWFDFEGNPIDVLPNGVARQVRRVVARGRPQLVYDGEGQPLCLPIAVSSAELRRAVGVDGLYRLYQIDENRRTIDGARAAHVPLRPSPALGRAPWDMPATAVPAANVPGAPKPRCWWTSWRRCHGRASRWPGRSWLQCRCWCTRPILCSVSPTKPTPPSQRRFAIL
jgi:hypothetical protein